MINNRNIVALFFISMVALLLWFSMPHGAILSVDSLVYASTGQSFAERGVFEGVRYDSTMTPTVVYPPVYPALIAPAYLLNSSIPWWAAILNVLFFVGLLFIFYRILSLNTYQQSWIPVLITTIIAFNISMMRFQRMALSESLSILGVLLTLWALSTFIGNNQTKDLVIAAFSAAVVMLTRYAEWPLLGTGVLGLLVFSRATWRKKVISAMTFGLIAGFPTALWLLFNRIRTGSTTSLQTSFSWRFVSRIVEIWDTFSIITTHHNVPLLLRWVISLVIIVLIVRILHKVSQRSGWRQICPPAAGFALLHVILYLGFIMASLAFSSLEGMNLGERRFIGSWILLLLAAGIWIDMYLSSAPPKIRRTIIRALTVYATITVIASVIFAARSRAREEGFASQAWQNTEVWNWLEGVPEDITIFSNGIDIVFYHTGKLLNALPVIEGRKDSQWRQSHQTSFELFHKKMTQSDAVILWFHNVERSHFFPTINSLCEAISLSVIYEDDITSVFALSSKSLPANMNADTFIYTPDQ